MELEYYGGDGFGGVPEKGIYEVRWGQDDDDSKLQKFNSLSKAKECFYNINESKSIFCIHPFTELIECWTVKQNNEK